MTLFRQVHSHEKLQFFRLSGKPFKLMKNTTTWPQDTWNVNIYPFGWEICKNVKLAKMTLFRQVHGHENLQFFRLSGKPFKLMKNTTTWPQDTWNVNIYPFGWEICKNVKLAKMTLFRQVHGHENPQFFRLSGKPFKLMKNTTTWPQDTWNVNIYPFGWEICKNVKLAKMTLFWQGCGHENLQFFWLSGKPFKLIKNTTTWPQDTWNVNIYTFGWEICKIVKLAKMTLFRQVRGHENLQFFWLSGKPYKLMINTTTWPQDS